MQTHRSNTEIIIKSEPCEQQRIWYRTGIGQAEVFQFVQWTVESSSAFPIQNFQTTPCSGVDVVIPWVEKVQSRQKTVAVLPKTGSAGVCLAEGRRAHRQALVRDLVLACFDIPWYPVIVIL